MLCSKYCKYYSVRVPSSPAIIWQPVVSKYDVQSSLVKPEKNTLQVMTLTRIVLVNDVHAVNTLNLTTCKCTDIKVHACMRVCIRYLLRFPLGLWSVLTCVIYVVDIRVTFLFYRENNQRNNEASFNIDSENQNKGLQSYASRCTYRQFPSKINFEKLSIEVLLLSW